MWIADGSSGSTLPPGKACSLSVYRPYQQIGEMNPQSDSDAVLNRAISKVDVALTLTHRNVFARVVRSTLSLSSPGFWKSTTRTAACLTIPKLGSVESVVARQVWYFNHSLWWGWRIIGNKTLNTRSRFSRNIFQRPRRHTSWFFF